MTTDELIDHILQQFHFSPTVDQRHAIGTFATFMLDRNPLSAMMLRGSAGTGKTSLAGAIVQTLKRLGLRVVLLAPTGRAAKVFAMNSSHEAFTIHRRIYRERSYQGIDGQFNLNNNLHHDTLFIVDEASMIATGTAFDGAGSMFGSGRLLDDLIHYIYSGQNCRMLLIGDTAQLPPIGEDEAPALNRLVVEGYGLSVYESDLREVLRQSQQSGILYNATTIRTMITHETATALPKIRFHGFADVAVVRGSNLIEQLNSSYAEVGTDETMVITRSNKRANIYNQGIRNMVLGREEELSGGDMLMVVKNKYLTPPNAKDREKADHGQPSFIANGDRCVVERVRNLHELYGFRFADVLLRFPDYDDFELHTTVILDTLTSESPSLTHAQQEQLYQQVMADYADIPLKADRMKALRDDCHFNALQIKYAYAVTCHKAQGGQWAHVYLDQGYMTDEMLSPDYIHWLYTAFTRATEKLFLVNWPATQTDGTLPEE